MIIPRQILVFLFLFCSFVPAFAANVVYLGGAAASQSAATNPVYSLKTRFQDLFDFSGGRKNDSARSGKISGTFSQEVAWNDISGNTSKSFLRRGTDYVDELRLNVQEKLPQDYHLESQLFLRKTDNRRIEPRKDVRLKQINIKLMNPQNVFEFGDSYAEFSQMTLGSSVEGFNMALNPDDSQQYKLVLARVDGADSAARKFQRNVFGVKADHNFFRESPLFSGFRTGVQTVLTRDDTSTLERTADTAQIHNSVTSIDGDISFKKYLSLNYEVAGSSYAPDLESDTHKQGGFAMRFQPALDLGKSKVRYLYNYVQPKFYTDVGSASPDKMQHQVVFDRQINDRNMLSFTENYYWDHLKGSPRTKRTTNDEKYLVWTSRPFASRSSFSFRPYANYQLRTSDDPGNTASGKTRTGGFSLNDMFGKTNVGLNYEYRAFTDTANRTSSDYTHRFGFNVARDQQFFGRRLYYGLDPSANIRSTKTSSKKDVNFNLGANAQYDIARRLVFRLGKTLLDADGSKPATDYMNLRGFMELDYRVSKSNAARFVVRGERNRYVHEDGNQSYNETRVVAKFIANF